MKASEHADFSHGIAPWALAGLLSLSACGGGGGGGGETPPGGGGGDGFTIGGAISGNDSNVTLSLNGTQQSFSGPGFTFGAKVAASQSYNVTFVSTPTNQKCAVTNGSGTATGNVSDVKVICTAPLTYYRLKDASPTGQLNEGDFNGDGFPDLAFSMATYPEHPLGAHNGVLHFLFGDGSGLFPDEADHITTGSFSTKRGKTSLAADLNNDGIDDLAEIIYGPQIIAYAGSMSQTFSTLFLSSKESIAPMVAFDFDGNGYKDFIALNVDGCGGPPFWDMFAAYTNDGGALTHVSSGVTCGTGFQLTGQNLAYDDFDNDGKTDLLVIGYTFDLIFGNEMGLVFLKGDGAGGFTGPASIMRLPSDMYLGGGIISARSKDIAHGDFNGDGNADIAITSNVGFVLVMLGDGAGAFTEGQRVKTGFEPLHVQAADFNKDGYLDLVSVHEVTKSVQISLGKGDGTFGDLDEVGGHIVFPLKNNVSLYDMVVTDLNGDGYPDIAVADETSDGGDMGNGSIIVILSPGK